MTREELNSAGDTIDTEHLKRWSCVHYVRSEKCCNITKHTCTGSGCGKWDTGLQLNGEGKWVAPDETR